MMNQEYLEKWTEMAKKMQEPLHDLVELNIKTLQGLSFLKPEDFTKIKSPEEIVDKQLSLAVENGHKTIDYIGQSCGIFEKALKNLVKETKKTVKVN